jgi:hypothetical protein
MVSDSSGEFIGTTAAPPTGDRIELTDLEVIQRWSLAVRGASADRAEVVATLRADLAWLERGRTPTRERRPVAKTTAKKTATKSASKSATKSAAKSASARSSSRSSTTRGGARRR